MNLPLGDTLYLNRNTKNLATGILADAVAMPTLLVRSGEDTLTGLTVTVKKIGVGRYSFALVLDPAKFVAGRTYTVFVNYTAFNNIVSTSLTNALEVEESLLTFRAVKAETTPGVALVQVSAFSTGITVPNSAGITTLLDRVPAKLEFPSNFTKLLIDTEGKVTPLSVTVGAYATGMAPASMAQMATQTQALLTAALTKPLHFATADGLLTIDIGVSIGASNAMPYNTNLVVTPASTPGQG